MGDAGEPPTTPATDPTGEAWVLWGALFLRLALRGGELLWLTNVPYLRWRERAQGEGWRGGGRRW
ncbi:MAG: hypothetical protein ACREKH_01955 [Candidatus Rokuibacteriota bacterium]